MTGERPDFDGDNISCPVCESQRSKVTDSRPHQHSIRRRRKCKNCEYRFWTKEVHCDFNMVQHDIND